MTYEQARVTIESLEAVLIRVFAPYRLNYREYIQSAAWKRKADAAKERAGYRCQICNRHKGAVQLEAHHRTYERLGHERAEDITVLCRDCHELYTNSRRMK